MTLKRTACLVVAILVGVGSLFSGVLVVFKLQDLIDAFIKSELPLRRDSEPFELWRKPPVTPMLKVWFFNVTNVENFLNYGEKLRLREVGPYVYSEKWEKIGVEWHPNGTLSYRQKKIFTFEPTMSIGSEEDNFTLPNVPLISAVSQMKSQTDIVKKALATLMDILKLEPFVTQNVKKLMWGYDDPLIKLGKQTLNGSLPYDNFGFFVDRNNTESKVYTVYSGQENLEDFARIDVYDGKKKMNFWKTDACNMINGTDGTGFPTPLTNNSNVYLFNPDLCGSLHLRYNYTVEHQGFVAYRFMPVPATFGSVENYPENDCYCLEKPCSKQGLFNISKCQFGSPIALSFPHFLHGDPTLLDDVDGLRPDPARHQFYLDIQPKLGIAMQAKGRVQINIQMTRVKEIKQTAKLQNVLVPVLWFEDGIDELPPKITSLLNQAIHGPEIAKTALSYVTFILGSIVLLGAVVYMIRNAIKTKDSSSKANGHSKYQVSDMEKTTNGVTNGVGKHQYANSMLEMDDQVKHQNGTNKNGLEPNHKDIVNGKNGTETIIDSTATSD